jgi:hypothetical protein
MTATATATRTKLRKRNPENLRFEIQKGPGIYPTGTTLFCHNPHAPVSKIIRIGLNAYWDHTATLVWYFIDDVWQPFIVEAKGGEKVHAKCFYAWLKLRQDNHFGLSPATVDLKRIEAEFGKRYYFVGAIVFMPLLRITHYLVGVPIWFGPTAPRSRWVCFPLSAWFRQKEKWWRKVPDAFGNFE